MTAPPALRQVISRDGPDRPAAGGPGRPGRLRAAGVPYVLVLPAVAVLAVVLGYPLVRLVEMSLQEYGLRQQFGAPAEFVGLANYRRIATDPQFWAVLVRTVAFCGVTVALTMTVGMLVALLMNVLGRAMRTAVGLSLLLAWALPPLSSTIVWQWMFDTQYGLVNWLLTRVGAGDFRGHSWLSEPLSFFSVAAAVVVWMGVPFVALTLYAGLTQVPAEVLEAAELDGAGSRQRFRHVTLAYLRPVVLILTALSVLWNFRVFTQIYVLQRAGGVNRDTNVLGVYAYRISIGENRFDVGSAVAVVMVGLTLLLTAVYLRQMMRQEEL